VHHGDLIKSVDGQKVETFEDLRRLVASSSNDTPLPLVVDRDGVEHTLTFTLPKGEPLGVQCFYQTATVRKISTDMPAADAGIEVGDTITRVDGTPLRGWLDFRSHVRPSAGERLTLTLEREGKTRTVDVTPKPSDSKWPGFTVHLPTTIGFLRPGAAAAEKLQKGDRITAVNGQAVTTWDEIERAVLAGPPNVALTVEREGKTTQLTLSRGSGIRATDSLGISPRLAYVVGTVEHPTEPPIQPGDVIVKARGKDIAEEINAGGLYTPMDDVLSGLATVGTVTVQRGDETLDISFEALDRKIGLIGVEATPEVIHRQMGFIEAIGPAFRQTWSMFTFSFTMIGKLITGGLKFGNLMGPVGIIQHTYISARQGLAELFRLIHLITVSIGVFNLIPIPPLDGGRIVMVAYEKIRGKAPGRKFQEALILAGVGVVLLIFVVATFNDMKRLFGL
jgi:RIP metalloprotease RseP